MISCVQFLSEVVLYINTKIIHFLKGSVAFMCPGHSHTLFQRIRALPFVYTHMNTQSASVLLLTEGARIQSAQEKLNREEETMYMNVHILQ